MKKILYILLALLVSLPLSAQKQDEEQKDSLIWLMSAKSAKMVDAEGGRYRKVVGPARFLHNGTFLLCDTALWNMETKVIDAWGHVSILQDETVLTSDNLKYLVDEDLAQFRGSVVQLTDKDHNTLRTRHLDYNTKDSVAVFKNGGSMRDKDGQIIESRDGTYDSKIKIFTFENDVNMFTDSIFVKTNTLIYESDKSLATFGSGTNAWQDDNMLSSEKGWYNSDKELFLFHDDVHVMTPDQEGWCDSLYFHRATQDVEMLGNAQMSDTTRNIFSLAGRIQSIDSLAKVTFTRKPAFITQTEEENGTVDTVYLGAEKLVYYTVKMCDIKPSEIKDSEKRLKDLDVDPVGEFRKKAAEAAAKAAEEAAMNDPNYRAKKEAEAKAEARAKAESKASSAQKDVPKMVPGARMGNPDEGKPAVADSLKVNDSLSVNDSLNSLDVADTLAVMDSLAVADSVEVEVVQPDTTKIGFLEALHNVRIFKKDMQVACDSLVYTDLDSLARLYKEPLIWQEVRRQYTADSITVVISDGAMQKASLMSNAFITIEQDSTHFNQIKCAEMLAFFDDKGGLERFDVLGGATALFYLEENGVLATVNKTDSKMLSASFANGEIQKIYYYDQPKNDGYPIVQLSEEEQRLTGFVWNPEKRPTDRTAVTPLALRPSQRRMYNARPKAAYRQTDIYCPGYMKGGYKQIEEREALKRERELERQLAEERGESEIGSISEQIQNLEAMPVEDVNTVADSLSTKEPMIGLSDSLAVADTVAKVLTPEEIKAAEKAAKEKAKAEKKAAKEQKAKEKQEALEAKWAEMDRRDAEKAAAKEEQRLEKERNRKRKALENAAKKAQREAELLEKYQRRYRNRKNRSN